MTHGSVVLAGSGVAVAGPEATVAASRSRTVLGTARRVSEHPSFGVGVALLVGASAVVFVGALVPGLGPLPDALAVVPAWLSWTCGYGTLFVYVVTELLAATAHYRAHPDYDSLPFDGLPGSADDWRNLVRRFRIWRFVMSKAHWWLLPASLLLAFGSLPVVLVAPPLVASATGWYGILVAPAGLQLRWWEDDGALREEMASVLDLSE